MVDDSTIERRYLLRVRHSKHSFGCNALSTFSSAFYTFIATIHSHKEPGSYDQTTSIPEWKADMSEELAALQCTT